MRIYILFCLVIVISVVTALKTFGELTVIGYTYRYNTDKKRYTGYNAKIDAYIHGSWVGGTKSDDKGAFTLSIPNNRNISQEPIWVLFSRNEEDKNKDKDKDIVPELQQLAGDYTLENKVHVTLLTVDEYVHIFGKEAARKILEDKLKAIRSILQSMGEESTGQIISLEKTIKYIGQKLGLTINRAIMDFKSLKSGVGFGGFTKTHPGTTILIEDGISVSIKEFKSPTGNQLFGDCWVEDWAPPRNKVMHVNNLNLSFDFQKVGFKVNKVTFEFWAEKGNENISISVNGSEIHLAELEKVPSNIASGVQFTVSISSRSDPSHKIPTRQATLTGRIYILLVGGQEFRIDNVVAERVY